MLSYLFIYLSSFFLYTRTRLSIWVTFLFPGTSICAPIGQSSAFPQATSSTLTLGTSTATLLLHYLSPATLQGTLTSPHSLPSSSIPVPLHFLLSCLYLLIYYLLVHPPPLSSNLQLSLSSILSFIFLPPCLHLLASLPTCMLTFLTYFVFMHSLIFICLLPSSSVHVFFFFHANFF